MSPDRNQVISSRCLLSVRDKPSVLNLFVV